MPDTLDLSARAELAINALTGMLDPEFDYEIYFTANFHSNPGYFEHERTGLATNNPKFAESLPMMRVDDALVLQGLRVPDYPLIVKVAAGTDTAP